MRSIASSRLAAASPRYSFVALICIGMAGSVEGQDAAGLSTPLGRRPIELWPVAADVEIPKVGTEITLGDWKYRAVKEPNTRDGVPWKLIVTPVGKDAGEWQKGSYRARGGGLPMIRAGRIERRPQSRPKKQDPNEIPVVEFPKILWQQRMTADLQNVVGIHFHEYVSKDVAQIMFTVHKVPPDNADGTPPEPGSYRGQYGSRLEATLLAPVAWSLDQSVVVRVDSLNKELAAGRAKHEMGHAEVSQLVLPAVLRGPQDWSLEYCTGRRSNLEYYWKRERIGRSWQGYYGGVGKLLTLRTTVVLVPPTRWSLLLPVSPERVTQKHIQQFNDNIVHLGPQLTAADKRAQTEFHADHGQYENPGVR